MSDIKIYTDGACSGNPGKGGWAYILIDTGKCEVYKEHGGERDTTNNKMELMSVFKAITYCIKQNIRKITIYSDSAYVVNAFKFGWLKSWKANNWKKKDGETIKNKELWKELSDLLEGYPIKVDFVKVKGHSGDTFNEMVDKLAKLAIEYMEE